MNKRLAPTPSQYAREAARPAGERETFPSNLAGTAAGLGDPSPHVRGQAVERLARHADGTLPLLGQVLFADPDPRLRQRAVEILRMRDTPAADALIRAALADPDPGVRVSAQRVLADRPPGPVADDPPLALGAHHAAAASALPAGMMAQLRRREPAERIAAIEQLHGAPPDVALETLRTVIAHDPEAAVRAAAVAAMRAIAAPGTAEALAAALGDADTAVRGRALDALVAGHWDTLPLLGQVLLGDPSPELRGRALERIAQAGTIGAMALIEQAASDPDNGVRRLAAFHLAR